LLIFLVFIFLTLRSGLFAFGKKEAPVEQKPLNTEWTLCITAFDTSAMSPSWQTAGDTVARSLSRILQNLNFRLRGEGESTYHVNYAWAKSRTAAAEAIAKKRNERDLLIFRGDPEAKFQKDLKTIEDAILKLEEELAKLDAPLVEGKPVFILNEKNLSGIFPLPPEPGRENRFCAEQKADAFLVGNLSEYYGRMFLNIKMYTRYTASYSYEDHVLFSSDDFEKAMDELGSRLVVAVSENFPSAVLVRATPPEAMVLIDGVYTGPDVHTRSPGTAEIAVQADNYIPVSFPLELNAGELTEIFINLTPLGRNAFEVDVSGSSGSKVYLGSLYAGETPLVLELPRNEFSHISVETPKGEIGSVIFRDNNIVKGSAQFFGMDDSRGRADFITALPLLEEEKQVAKARDFFYRFYGAFWFVLPAALLTSGIANTYIEANNHYGGGSGTKLSNSASTANFVSTAAYGMIGAALGATFYQIFNYIKASGGDSTPIVKAVPKETKAVSTPIAINESKGIDELIEMDELEDED
jgi:hypothetical protein